MNCDINNTACLHVVHILQHPTWLPFTKTTQILCAVLRKWIFYQFLLPNTANWRSTVHDDVIRQMKAWPALKQNGFEFSEHCTQCNAKRCLLWRKVEKCNCLAMMGKRSAFRIMWIERQLWQGRESMTQWQWSSRSSMNVELPKRQDWQPQSPKQHFGGCWM